MKSHAGKQAFLILCDHICEPVLRLYFQIKTATAGMGDAYILYHTKGDREEMQVSGTDIREFSNGVLHELGYSPIGNTLVPGNNHFPVLKFYLDNPGYDYYWCIEDDVVFTGEWLSFFGPVSREIEYDFISCFIRLFRDEKDTESLWVDGVRTGQHQLDKDAFALSFNPVYSLSNRAADFLDKSLKQGWAGHHEVLMPTLFITNGFKVKDFGGEGKFVPNGFRNRFYDRTTHLWRPPFKMAGNMLNKIYHPVKTGPKFNGDFQYKISFCVLVKEPYSINHTLIKNINDNLQYEDFEFLILDISDKNTLDIPLTEDAVDWISKEKLVYYRPVEAGSLTDEDAKEIALRVATGDIICWLGADQLTGPDLAWRINDGFKLSVRNIADHPGSQIPELSFPAAESQITCIIKPGCEKINNIHINLTGYLKPPGTLYIHLSNILVQYIDPSSSRILYLYNHGEFHMGSIVNNITRGNNHFSYTYSKRNIRRQYALSRKHFTTGRWHLSENGERIHLIKKNGKLVLEAKKDCYGSAEGDFHSITNPATRQELIRFHQQYSGAPSDTASDKITSVSADRTIVYKNFEYNRPIILNR